MNLSEIETYREQPGSLRQVEAARLRDDEELSYREIGDRLGVTRGRAWQLVELGRRFRQPEATRVEAARLRDDEGLSYREIGDRLRVTGHRAAELVELGRRFRDDDPVRAGQLENALSAAGHVDQGRTGSRPSSVAPRHSWQVTLETENEAQSITDYSCACGNGRGRFAHRK